MRVRTIRTADEWKTKRFKAPIPPGLIAIKQGINSDQIAGSGGANRRRRSIMPSAALCIVYVLPTDPDGTAKRAGWRKGRKAAQVYVIMPSWRIARYGQSCLRDRKDRMNTGNRCTAFIKSLPTSRHRAPSHHTSGGALMKKVSILSLIFALLFSFCCAHADI